ncbi:hypothetical protein GF1_25450 [Desulfolithobacter dissulfuricans]|uniref:histidine kinase n=1 Tax=Desulfolithobacter dissulfuricans TaxID=2795293 RepID=A0A915U2I7_9BACT|nr:PAS domain-containing protein [Desulfolithobacter dissulfuricans]BCO10169.1 hypothetical protein GF1_25450 [Desulfolithobacter dissulfuricans]
MSERYRVIFFVGLTFFFFSAIYLYQGKNHYDRLLDLVVEVTENKFNEAIDAVEELSFIPFGEKISQLLANSPGIIAAFAARDRDLLYRRVLPGYTALRAQNSLFVGMYFYLPDGTVFLRMDNPSLFGDDQREKRPVLVAVNHQGTQQAGYELGPQGLVYRIVQPVFYRDTYIGALEYEIKACQFLDLLSKKINAPVSVFFRSDLVESTSSTVVSGLKRFGGFSLQVRNHEIFSRLPTTLHLDRGDQQLVIDGTTYLLHAHFLFRNYQGLPVGGIVALQDISPFLQQRAAFFRRSAVILLSLATCVLLVLYLRFGRISSSLVAEIVSRKKAEAAACRAEKEWERTVDAVPEFISILDRECRIVRANRRLPEAMGLAMEEVLGRYCYELFCGQEEKPEFCPYTTVQADHKVCSQEMLYERLGCYFDVTLSPLYDDDNRFIGAVHVARNINQRKIVEQQARKNLLYLQSILEASRNTAIVATDDTLTITYCNPAVERLLGYPPDLIIGQSIRALLSRHGSGVSSMLEKVMDGLSEFASCQFQLQHGDYILDAQISTMTDQEGSFSGVLFIGRDVTAQKEAEEKLRRAEKLEAIGLLAGGVAHDLNNILSGVINYPELLRLKLPDDCEVQELLTKLQQAGQHAADVVADLLTMARGIALEKEIVSINSLVQEYIASPEYAELCSRCPEGTVNVELGRDCWSCRCSATHILKILMNLVGNAMEALNGPGTVSIRTYNHAGRPPQADEEITADEFVVLEIRDTGPGIRPEHLPHIFEPFYSTKELGHSGTGLGLSIVWNTVQEHGGLLTVNSDRKGTVFTIYLPAHREEADRPAGTERPDSLENIRGSGTVLVVDDDEEQRIMVRKMLSVLGYTVHTASSGEEAIAWIQDHPVDVLLLDMMMSRA